VAIVFNPTNGFVICKAIKRNQLYYVQDEYIHSNMTHYIPDSSSAIAYSRLMKSMVISDPTSMMIHQDHSDRAMIDKPLMDSCAIELQDKVDLTKDDNLQQVELVDVEDSPKPVVNVQGQAPRRWKNTALGMNMLETLHNRWGHLNP
jgi:hypothetical protein